MVETTGWGSGASVMFAWISRCLEIAILFEKKNREMQESPNDLPAKPSGLSRVAWT